MTEWYDEDAFWRGTGGLIFTDDRLKQAVEEVEQIAALLPLAPGARVLDLACGVGRHSSELARRGYTLTGVDRTADYISLARATAEKEALSAEWVVEDMRAFRRPEAFDAALNLLTSFGYFDDPADDRRVLDNLFASLKPGGRLLIDLMGKEVLARIFQPREWSELPGGAIWLQERTITRDWARVEVRWTLIKDGERREHAFGHRLYSAESLRGLAEAAGFEAVRIFGSFKGTPYNHEAQRLVLAARKPA